MDHAARGAPASYRASLALITMAVLVLGAPSCAVAAGPALMVCLLEHNLPYSERASDSGFDRDVADAVARASGRTFEPVWINNATRLTEIDDSDYPLARLERDGCDAIFSLAGPAAETLAGRATLTLGAAYYGAAFELMSCATELPADLAAWSGRSIAIQSQSVAHFALLRLDATPRNYFSFDEAFSAVVNGAAEGGLLWGPVLGLRLRLARISGASKRDPALAACQLSSGYVPPRALRWNLHVATRASEKRLRADIDRALATMIASGELDQLKRSYGLPLHAPFASTHTRDALDELGPAPKP